MWTVTAEQLEAINENWLQCPPLHVMARNFLGIKPQGKKGKSARQGFKDLFDKVIAGGGNL